MRSDKGWWFICYWLLILAPGVGASRAHADQKPSCEFASLVELRTVTALPAEVLPTIGKMADRDQPFNAADYVEAGLPNQRFIVAGMSLSCLLVEYEKGGFAPSTEVQEFVREEDSRWRKSRSWKILSLKSVTLTNLLRCLEVSWCAATN